MVLYSELPLK